MSGPTSIHARFEGIQSILRVEDMQASLRFYVDVLGFSNASWGTDDFTSTIAQAALFTCAEEIRGVAGPGSGLASMTWKSCTRN